MHLSVFLFASVTVPVHTGAHINTVTKIQHQLESRLEGVKSDGRCFACSTCLPILQFFYKDQKLLL